MTAGYFRFNTRDGNKVYVPSLSSLGKTRHLKMWHKTATAAEEYAAKTARRLERFLANGKKA